MSSEKDERREVRLSIRPQTEEKLRNELKDMAFSNCKTEVHEFGECAKTAGLGVIFQCREHSKTMSKCLDKYFSDEKLDEYIRSKGYVPRNKKTLVDIALSKLSS